MSVYGTYLHVIGVIIKMRPAFVFEFEASESRAQGFNNGVSVTDTLKVNRFEKETFKIYNVCQEHEEVGSKVSR